MDGSVSVQRMAYQLLHEAAKKYTEELVIEAAVDTEGDLKPMLPAELLDIMQQSLDHEDTDEYGQVSITLFFLLFSAEIVTGMVRLPLSVDGRL